MPEWGQPFTAFYKQPLGRGRRHGGRWIPPVRLANRQQCIDRYVHQAADGSIGPFNPKRIDPRTIAQPEVHSIVHRRLIAANDLVLVPPAKRIAKDGHLSPECPCVGWLSVKLKLEVMSSGPYVFIQSHRLINAVNHHIQIAVAVQIGIGGSVGEGRVRYTPHATDIFERTIPTIAKHVIRSGQIVKRANHCNQAPLHRVGPQAPLLPEKRNHAIPDEIHVGDGPPVAIGNPEIAIAVLIEVGQQRGPAPVRGVDTGQLAYFTKSKFSLSIQAVVDLECVAPVLVMIASRKGHLIIGKCGQRKSHPLALIVIRG